MNEIKVKYRGAGKVFINNVAHEFRDGDIIDLPDDVAERLVKDNRFFEFVEEEKMTTKRVKVS